MKNFKPETTWPTEITWPENNHDFPRAWEPKHPLVHTNPPPTKRLLRDFVTATLTTQRTSITFVNKNRHRKKHHTNSSGIQPLGEVRDVSEVTYLSVARAYEQKYGDWRVPNVRQVHT
ncbi:hypothetical protein TNCV_535771 [Trichonephila clavipes]|nr:hypothetical protein TNCV_535771 [Trichonephila clavipes]